jgi:hypothetical protein
MRWKVIAEEVRLVHPARATTAMMSKEIARLRVSLCWNQPPAMTERYLRWWTPHLRRDFLHLLVICGNLRNLRTLLPLKPRSL